MTSGSHEARGTGDCSCRSLQGGSRDIHLPSSCRRTLLLLSLSTSLKLRPASARVLTERLLSNGEAGRQTGLPMPDKRLSKRQEGEELNQRSSVKEQVAEIRRLTAEGRKLTDDGSFQQALDIFTDITLRYPDLAVTNFARISRALLLFQTGSRRQAILELEDLEASLRGFAEVHAALACMTYAEKPQEVSYAEEQWDLASEFDTRYSNVQWVATEKHWPPALLTALDRFIKLQ